MEITGASENKPKGYRYICVANCTFKGKYYRIGDVIDLAEKREVPHFKPAEEKK